MSLCFVVYMLFQPLLRCVLIHMFVFSSMFPKVRPGEILVFSAMMHHEVEVVGAEDGWHDRSISLSLYVRLKRELG